MMYKEIKLVLSPAEVVELTACLQSYIEETKNNIPTQFLTEIKEKLVDQLSAQFDSETMDQAEHEFLVQALLKKAP